jgi:hypothetical protein
MMNETIPPFQPTGNLFRAAGRFGSSDSLMVGMARCAVPGGKAAGRDKENAILPSPTDPPPLFRQLSAFEKML